MTPSEHRRRTIVVNERCRARAQALNGLAIAFVASFLISPFIEKFQTDIVMKIGTYVWVGLAIVLHMGSHYLLGLLQLED